MSVKQEYLVMTYSSSKLYTRISKKSISNKGEIWHVFADPVTVIFNINTNFSQLNGNYQCTIFLPDAVQQNSDFT